MANLIRYYLLLFLLLLVLLLLLLCYANTIVGKNLRPKCSPNFWQIHLLASLPALVDVLPIRRSFFISMYIFAASESGKGDGSVGISAPFCSRSSATGNGFRGIGLEGRGGVVADICPDGTRMLDEDSDGE